MRSTGRKAFAWTYFDEHVHVYIHKKTNFSTLKFHRSYFWQVFWQIQMTNISLFSLFVSIPDVKNGASKALVFTWTLQSDTFVEDSKIFANQVLCCLNLIFKIYTDIKKNWYKFSLNWICDYFIFYQTNNLYISPWCKSAGPLFWFNKSKDYNIKTYFRLINPFMTEAVII